MENQNETSELLQIAASEDNIILENQSPWVFLASPNKEEHLEVQKICELYRLERKTVKGFAVYFSRAKDKNHKEKALLLFFAGINLICHNPVSQFFLGQINILAQRIQHQHLPSHDFRVSEDFNEDFKNWRLDSQLGAGSIFLGNEIKIYLQHAGICLNTDYVFAKEFVESLFQSKQRKNHHSKVG